MHFQHQHFVGVKPTIKPQCSRTNMTTGSACKTRLLSLILNWTLLGCIIEMMRMVNILLWSFRGEAVCLFHV